MSARTWLIQLCPGLVEELNEQDLGEPYLAADRPNTDAQIGDHLVLWQTGRNAGVIGLGVVADVADVLHPRNYRDPDGPDQQRRSVKVRFTHHCPAEQKISKADLVGDPAFAGFQIFRRGGAQGRNPFPVEQAQWRAILDRLDGGGNLAGIGGDYDVTMDLLTSAADLPSALRVLRAALDEPHPFDARLPVEMFRRMGVESRPVWLSDPADDDCYTQPPIAAVQPGDRLLSYRVRQFGFTPIDAMYRVFRHLDELALPGHGHEAHLTDL